MSARSRAIAQQAVEERAGTAEQIVERVMARRRSQRPAAVQPTVVPPDAQVQQQFEELGGRVSDPFPTLGGLVFSPAGRRVGQRIEELGATIGDRLSGAVEGFQDALFGSPVRERLGATGRSTLRFPSELETDARALAPTVAATIPRFVASAVTPQNLAIGAATAGLGRAAMEVPAVARLANFPLETLPGQVARRLPTGALRTAVERLGSRLNLPEFSVPTSRALVPQPPRPTPLITEPLWKQLARRQDYGGIGNLPLHEQQQALDFITSQASTVPPPVPETFRRESVTPTVEAGTSIAPGGPSGAGQITPLASARPVRALGPLRGTTRLSREAIQVVSDRIYREHFLDPSHPPAPDDETKIVDTLTKIIHDGEVDLADVPYLNAKYSDTPDVLARDFRKEIRLSAQNLNTLSQIKRRTLQLLREVPDEQRQRIADALGERLPQLSSFDKVRNNIYTRLRPIVNASRASFVAQWATTARIAQSHLLNWSTRALEDGLIGAWETATGDRGAREAFQPAVEDMMAVMRQLNPAQRQRLHGIMWSNPAVTQRLYQSIVGDLTLSRKYTNLITTPHRIQEFFFKRIAFDATMRTALLRQGANPDTISPLDIPEDVWRKGIAAALDMTYQRPIGQALGQYGEALGNFGRAVERVFYEHPLLYSATDIQFPRFLANKLMFLVDHSPAGLLRLATTPRDAASIAEGFSPETSRVWAQAATGTMMMGLGWALRHPRYAGEHPYEVKVMRDGRDTGRRVDFRANFPVSEYMFLGQVLRQVGLGQPFGPPLEARDYKEAMIGLSRLGNWGNPFNLSAFFSTVAGALRGDPRTVQHFRDYVLDSAGSFLSAFTTPLRMASDVVGALDPDEAILRGTRDSVAMRLFGPTIRNVPGLSRTLPPVQTALREESSRREHTLRRQLTGITTTAPNALEREASRLGLHHLGSHTGLPVLDRAINAQTARELAPEAAVLLTSPDYMAMEDNEKSNRLGKLAAHALSRIRQSVLAETPELAAGAIADQLRGQSPTVRRSILRSWKQKGVLTAPVRNQLRELIPSLEDERF